MSQVTPEHGELTIPEEAEEFRFYCGCEKRCGRMGFELEGIDFIVAAELERLIAETFPYGVRDDDDYYNGIELLYDLVRHRAKILRGEA